MSKEAISMQRDVEIKSCDQQNLVGRFVLLEDQNFMQWHGATSRWWWSHDC